MQAFGPFAFWLVLAATFGAVTLYALYRMTQRPGVPVAETESYLGVLPTTSPVAVEAAGAWAAEQAETERGRLDAVLMAETDILGPVGSNRVGSIGVGTAASLDSRTHAPLSMCRGSGVRLLQRLPGRIVPEMTVFGHDAINSRNPRAWFGVYFRLA